MRRLLWVFVFLAPLIAWAQTPFDGTWRWNPDRAQYSKKPERWVLQNGTYTCSTCVPKIEVKADGQDQKVTGQPYFDTLNVRVVDDNTVETTGKKDGKVVSNEKYVVSDHGTRLTTEFNQQREGSSEPVTGKGLWTRAESGPAGSHAISGAWRPAKLASISENALLLTYKSTENGLSMTQRTGESYDAKFDGKDYPYKGDPGITSVALRKIDERTFEETQKRDGKPIYVVRVSVAPDGRALKITVNDKQRGTTMSFVAEKQ